MKLFIAICALFAVALADVEVLKHVQDVHPDGTFNYALETNDGTSVQASGTAEGNHVGSFKFVSPEGTPVLVNYVADENGFQPSGDVLPVGPEVPPQILRALEYIRAHPPKE